MKYYKVKKDVFFLSFSQASLLNKNIAKSCCRLEDLCTSGMSFFLSEDRKSGYTITNWINDHDRYNLGTVFSSEKGRGKELVRSAVNNRANSLDCFDGYLVEFYKDLGFIEYKREANWTEGEPDVVFMARPIDMSGWAQRREEQFQININKLR